jgi:hypothetical protein
VGIQPDIAGVSRFRLTVPFDFLTEDVANKVYQFIVRSLAGMSPDPKCDLDAPIVGHLNEFLLQLRSGTIDAYLLKVKAEALKDRLPIAAPLKSSLRGVLLACSGAWMVRTKLRDVLGKEKSFKLPFSYLLEKDAGLAYDFAIVHFCLILNQKMNHKLNFPDLVLALNRQAELKSYVEEVLTNSYSFQVGKILPATPIVRGVDKVVDAHDAYWNVRVCIICSAGFLIRFVRLSGLTLCKTLPMLMII